MRVKNSACSLLPVVCALCKSCEDELVAQKPSVKVHGMQVRAAALTGTQCASYDAAKQAWMARTKMGDTPVTHLGASMITGLATTTITAPVDLIKTNMFVGAPPFHAFSVSQFCDPAVPLVPHGTSGPALWRLCAW